MQNIGTPVLPAGVELSNIGIRERAVTLAATDVILGRASARLPEMPQVEKLADDVTNLLVELTAMSISDIDGRRELMLSVGLLAAHASNSMLGDDERTKDVNQPNMVRLQTMHETSQLVADAVGRADRLYEDNQKLELEIIGLKGRTTQFPIHLSDADFHLMNPTAIKDWKRTKFAASEKALVKFINWAYEQDELASKAGNIEELRKQLKGVQDKAAAQLQDLVEARRKVNNATELVARRNLENSSLAEEVKALKERGGFDTTGTSAALARAEKDLYKSRLEIGQLAKELASAYDALQKERVSVGAPDGEELAKARQAVIDTAKELCQVHSSLVEAKVEIDRLRKNGELPLMEATLSAVRSQAEEERKFHVFYKAQAAELEKELDARAKLPAGSPVTAQWKLQAEAIEACHKAGLVGAANAVTEALLKSIKG